MMKSPDAVALYVVDPLMQRVIAEQALTQGLVVRFESTATAAAITVSAPLRLGALLQRIRQKDQRQSADAEVIILGRFIFIPADMLLVDDEEEILLTEKESAILICLAEGEGGEISRRDLLTKVWGYVEGVETHTLETHIYRLRQKLEVDPAKPEILLTAEQGYSLKIGDS